jgi:hypothetical protein
MAGLFCVFGQNLRDEHDWEHEGRRVRDFYGKFLYSEQSRTNPNKVEQPLVLCDLRDLAGKQRIAGKDFLS